MVETDSHSPFAASTPASTMVGILAGTLAVTALVRVAVGTIPWMVAVRTMVAARLFLFITRIPVLIVNLENPIYIHKVLPPPFLLIAVNAVHISFYMILANGARHDLGKPRQDLEESRQHPNIFLYLY